MTSCPSRLHAFKAFVISSLNGLPLKQIVPSKSKTNFPTFHRLTLHIIISQKNTFISASTTFH